MTLLETTTLAGSQARQNLQNNLAALRESQPQIVDWIQETPLAVEWVFSRDRVLSAIDSAGQWLGGCSVPRRAATEMLQRLEVKGSVACLLAPTHAQQIRQTLEKLRPEQAAIVIAPEFADLSAALHCDDFSSDIASHRLWFAAGAGWEAFLSRLLEARVGLAVPSSFVRLPDSDPAVVETLIQEAQTLFAALSQQRESAVRQARTAAAGRSKASRLLVVAPTRFRLWNDIGNQMLQALGDAAGLEVCAYDADDPLNASPQALVRAASECGAILTANTARSDLPGLLPETIPWLTWVTGGRVPSATQAGPRDRLLLVDPVLREVATRAGWAETQVHLAGWPRESVIAPPANAPLAIIADTVPLDVPRDLLEYSSHSLLWESIAQNLRRDPARLGDANAYLDEAMRRASVSDAAFPRARFIQQLIVPAYQHGVALALLKADVPLRTYGQGWDRLAEFSQCASGPITSRQQLHQAVGDACALVHAWPTRLSQPLEAFDRPLIRPRNLLADARAALAGRLPVRRLATPPLNAELVENLLKPP